MGVRIHRGRGPSLSLLELFVKDFKKKLHFSHVSESSPHFQDIMTDRPIDRPMNERPTDDGLMGKFHFQ